MSAQAGVASPQEPTMSGFAAQGHAGFAAQNPGQVAGTPGTGIQGFGQPVQAPSAAPVPTQGSGYSYPDPEQFAHRPATRPEDGGFDPMSLANLDDAEMSDAEK